METKIAIIAASKFNPANYSELIKSSEWTDIVHRNTTYKKIVAFEQYITGYPFDNLFVPFI
jgi:hypothetical protein